jgi:hypothetical protein
MSYSKFILPFIGLIFCLFACGGNAQPEMKEGANYYGEKIDDSGAVDLAQLTEQLTATDTVEIKMSGTIAEVCQAKGCWMNLSSANSDEAVFIKFKDYAFFMPKNSAGKNAIVSGKLYSSVTSVDELRHYAEDKGMSKEEIEKINEPKREWNMMADGVIIYN